MKVDIVAVDFDGTIVEDAFPQIGSLIPGAKKALVELAKAGKKIIIWTCRGGEDLEEMVDWLKANEIPFDAVNENIVDFTTARKVYADIYIDDRNYRTGNMAMLWLSVEVDLQTGRLG